MNRPKGSSYGLLDRYGEHHFRAWLGEDQPLVYQIDGVAHHQGMNCFCCSAAVWLYCLNLSSKLTVILVHCVCRRCSDYSKLLQYSDVIMVINSFAAIDFEALLELSDLLAYLPVFTVPSLWSVGPSYPERLFSWEHLQLVYRVSTLGGVPCWKRTISEVFLNSSGAVHFHLLLASSSRTIR